DRASQERAPHGPQLPPPPLRRRHQRDPRRDRLQLQPPPAVAQAFIAYDPGRPVRRDPRTSRTRLRLNPRSSQSTKYNSLRIGTPGSSSGGALECDAVKTVTRRAPRDSCCSSATRATIPVEAIRSLGVNPPCTLLYR